VLKPLICEISEVLTLVTSSLIESYKLKRAFCVAQGVNELFTDEILTKINLSSAGSLLFTISLPLKRLKSRSSKCERY